MTDCDVAAEHVPNKLKVKNTLSSHRKRDESPLHLLQLMGNLVLSATALSILLEWDRVFPVLLIMIILWYKKLMLPCCSLKVLLVTPWINFFLAKGQLQMVFVIWWALWSQRCVWSELTVRFFWHEPTLRPRLCQLARPILCVCVSVYPRLSDPMTVRSRSSSSAWSSTRAQAASHVT